MINIFWFRRDLRLDDNAGLFHALSSKLPVLPLFIFDTHILDDLPKPFDPRVDFIYKQVLELKNKLEKRGSTICLKYGQPADVFQELIEEFPIQTVFTNHDYEPYARKRDEVIKQLLISHEIGFSTFKDQVIFEKDEILKKDGKPYTIFTPYMRQWKAKLLQNPVTSFHSEKKLNHLFLCPPLPMPTLSDLGFKYTHYPFPPKKFNEELIKNYHLTRDFPGIQGTSRLGVHLRFGTISIRKLINKAIALNDTFLNELIWREFYMGNILWHYPQVIDQSFKEKFDRIPWRNNEEEFQAWCKGKTGYPMVDAGMRELNFTGFMHNRVRMLTASFLVKHLLIDWRWGESYFAEKLLDFELSSNNGGWQWAASSGCDAVPYFRIFNPESQCKKWDPDLKYVRKWVPEFDDPKKYIKPIVDYSFGRKRALETYQQAVNQ
ncbi:cryptochrome/photolyase family protein [Xanthovirga aplysinae]|uniref:cryptochrome/photolyase family protein n=1 Tax=Xanthovirga aplysinae TaxID=2529853 RepID=UPI0012BBC943|nr:deoxyribodipyrimidine photo-lyase [Xanthovirga aplysinae]MTI30461.1 deoxyribodipyrimidine photo-lyase [Xanthovirga aplysinae]